MLKVTRNLLLIVFAVLFSRAVLAEECRLGNNTDRRAKTTAVATPAATPSPSSAGVRR